jgi:hypothetical protein
LAGAAAGSRPSSWDRTPSFPNYRGRQASGHKFALREILLRASAAKNESDEGGDDADAD